MKGVSPMKEYETVGLIVLPCLYVCVCVPPGRTGTAVVLFTDKEVRSLGTILRQTKVSVRVCCVGDAGVRLWTMKGRASQAGREVHCSPSGLHLLVGSFAHGVGVTCRLSVSG